MSKHTNNAPENSLQTTPGAEDPVKGTKNNTAFLKSMSQ